MSAIGRAFFRPIVTSALATAVVVWAVLTTWAAIDQQRDEHATLAAAGAALRPAIAATAARELPQRLAGFADALTTWQLAAAAFDANGRFLGGDPDLRADGLPKGVEAAPPAGRQLSVVPAASGYVLLVREPNRVTRFRWTLAAQLASALALAALAGRLASAGWIAGRARASATASDDYRAIASGETRATASGGGDDPVFGDVTQAARAAIDRLAATVRDRAGAEERLRQFLADAGHELRTPLAIAVGYLGILKRGALADPVLAERIVRDVGAEHDRLSRLVDGILYLARLDAVPAEEGAATDVARIAREAIALVRPLGTDREIRCEDRADAFAAIGADDLRDALRNVLENALRYAAPSPVELAINTVDDAIVATVRDEGPGMDAFTAAHAFDRFFRGANREVPGTGLGLAIVRRIVERAGGTVRIASAAGSGTLVEIRLKRASLAAHSDVSPDCGPS